MPRHRAIAGIWLALICLCATNACGGGSSTPLAPVASTTSANAPTSAPAPTANQNLSTVAYANDALVGAKYLGPANFTATSVEIVPALADGPGLEAYAQSVGDPTSANFRNYLTPQEIGTRFGAPLAAYDATLAYFHAAGLVATGWPQRQLIHVAGTQRALERALDTTFGLYQSNGPTFVAIDAAPKLPSALGVASVAHAVGTEAYLGPIPLPPNGPGDAPGLSPQQLQRAFDYSGAYAAGYSGKGITVGIMATGQTSLPYDVQTVGALFGVPVANVAYAPVRDPSPAPTACTTPSATHQVTSPCISLGLTTPPTITPYAMASAAGCVAEMTTPSPTCVPDQGEAALDTQTVALLAPGSNVSFYLGYNPMYCAAAGGPYTTRCPGGGMPADVLAGSVMDAEFQQAIADDAVDVVSISFGSCETAINKNSYVPYAISSLVAEGVAVFASSGDDGAQSRCGLTTPAVGYPAADPNVVAVGGLFVPVDSTGQLDGQLAAWSFQNTAGSPAYNAAGSGGGYSTVWSEPASQMGITSVPNTGMRMIPDIALDASPHSQLQLVRFAGPGLDGPISAGGDGTSEAAPEAAAMWALVLQACAQTTTCATAAGPHPYRLGDPKPYLYGIYSGNAKGGMTYASTFFDVTYGNNSLNLASPNPTPSYLYGYQAGPGYDLVTGLGAPYARALIKAVVGV